MAKQHASFLFLCLGMLALSAHAAEADLPIAKLGTVELKSSQIQAILDTLDADARKRLKDNPEALTRIVQAEIIRIGVLKEATDKQWDKRSDVQKQLQRAREQTIVSSYLNDISRAPSSYPSEQEIKSFYDGNKNAFLVPARYRVAQIYIAKQKTDKNGEDSASKKAKDLAIKAKNEDFAKLASQHSEHKESAAKGGELGWLEEQQLIPELRDQLPKMSGGQVSAPIKTANGWHIVKLLEFKPAATSPLEEVRDLIASSMRMQKARELEQQYLEKMVASQQLSVNQTLLDELLK